VSECGVKILCDWVCEGEERKCNMAERRNSLVCTFDPISPNVTLYGIREWIHDILRIPGKTVNLMQIEGKKRQVHINLADKQCVQAVLRDTCGQAEYRHNNGEISTVGIAIAGMESKKKIRIANVP
jgi:hypothetical protein